MSKILNSLLAGSTALGVVLVAGSAIAAEPVTSVASLDQLNQYSREGQAATTGQVTSVSQLSDVKPTDWAFQALQSLVERYGCIVGYPDRTYRGNRALTRYEFAAGLNACMDRVNELIAAATADLVKKEDLATLQKLQEEFAAELATLRGRVDGLEAKTATLEKQQFSTTTKLSGEAIFALTGENGSKNKNGTVFQDRVRLTLNTSFTGKDRLVTRLAAGNATSFNTTGKILGTGGNEGTQTFNTDASGNAVKIDWVAYYTTLADKFNVYIPVTGGLHYDYAPTASSMDDGDGGSTTLSMFGQRNPIYAIGGGAGAGATFDLAGFKVSAGYLSGTANTPGVGSGVFGGDNSVLVQAAYAPKNSPLQVAATYVKAYNKSGGIFDASGPSLGTKRANDVNPLNNSLLNPLLNASSKVDAYGLSSSLRLGGGLSVNAFGMLAKVDEIGDGLKAGDVWSYGASLGVQDFGKKGSLLGVVVGVEPYYAGAKQNLGGLAFNNTGAPTYSALNKKAPFHIEGFYKYQLTDKVSVTPGLIWITSPGQSKGNNDTVIGTVRTTFSF
jgi:Carbohydrate-selective porin, OprB family/S-layer homology domain